VKGFLQIPGIDFTETYVVVVRLESFQMTAAIAAQWGLHIWQVGCVSAYLNSHLQHTVYMDLPPGLVVQGEELMVCLLDKTLYGMMQGAYDWWHELNGRYHDLGYYKFQADTCVHSCVIDSKHAITSTYTNNVFGALSTPKGAALATKELGECYEIKDVGNLQYILGMRIEHDPQTGVSSLSQCSYFLLVFNNRGQILKVRLDGAL
jgi:hypothetical protein